MTSPMLVAAAAKQLTLRQLAYRTRRFVPVRVLAGRAPPAPAFRPLAAGLAGGPSPQSGPVDPPDKDGNFRAVGSVRALNEPCFWTSGDDGLLFMFELHGFSALGRYAAGGRTDSGDVFWRKVCERWLDECGRPASPGWHPYPLSGRVMAWCAALSAGVMPAATHAAMTASLAWQLRLLRRSVEHDIGGNHVLRNGCALVIGGLCCGDAAAVRRGRNVLVRALPKQVLADGMHEERSPSYARVLLEDLQDVAEIERRVGLSPQPQLERAIEGLGEALSALSGPDGMLPRLNDAWDGPPLVPTTEPAVVDLFASGYIVLRHAQDQVIFDVGPLCPPHLPPHAHADALSFVLWLDGAPVVIDPGTGGYDLAARRWSRATRAHSTIEVDGQDQCVFWGQFRASHLPKVDRGALDVRSDATVLSARHDGYRRLADPVDHRRTFCWLPGDGLVIVDELVGGCRTAVSRLPLAPAGTGGYRIRKLDGGLAVSKTGVVAPYFGVTEPNEVLEQHVYAGVSGWIITRSHARVDVDVDVGTATVRRPGRELVHFAFR
jgi:hypothetical protein